jgi:hypothetical protein
LTTAHSKKSKASKTQSAPEPALVTNDGRQRVEIDPEYLDPIDLAFVRQQVTNLVANRALEVVHETLDQIGRGNYQAMKYLFEMVGLFPVTASDETSAENSLTTMLLNRFGGVAEGSPSGGIAAQSEKVDADTVK